uniref:Uncharacterized protein n=1 Tax=Fervidicoccus fontis TaxID=683846 RepID=A0A7J3ZK71_9CREN
MKSCYKEVAVTLYQDLSLHAKYAYQTVREALLSLSKKHGFRFMLSVVKIPLLDPSLVCISISGFMKIEKLPSEPENLARMLLEVLSNDTEHELEKLLSETSGEMLIADAS